MLTADRPATLVSDPLAPAAREAPGAAAGEALVWEGKAGELFAAWIKGLVLTILTLGIYRFWMKTALRRYIWSHLKLGGDAFEYTGTGGELFRGFLIVFLTFFLPAALLGLAAQWLGSTGTISQEAEIAVRVAASYGSFALLLLLVGYARFTGLRYRLSRTQWRGVAFGLEGTPGSYLWRYLLLGALNMLCLGLATPWVMAALERHRLGQARFGSVAVELHPAGVPFVRYWIAWMPLAICLVGTAWTMHEVMSGLISDILAGETVQPERMREQSKRMFEAYGIWAALPMSLLVPAYILFRILHVAQEVALYRYAARRFSLGTCRAIVDMSCANLVAMRVINWFLVVLTLGLGRPVAICLEVDYLATHLRAGPMDALAAAAQATAPAVRRGEGLLDALDAGIA